MTERICPRCDRPFPAWQPVHLTCLAGRSKFWLIGVGIVAASVCTVLFLALSIGVLLLSPRQADATGILSPTAQAAPEATQEAAASTQATHNVSFVEPSATRLPSKTPPPREQSRTPTPRASLTATTSPTPNPTRLIGATPKAVSADGAPLAIGFIIESVEISEESITVNVSIERQSDAELGWTSDENRKDQIYLEGGPHRYDLLLLGGIFLENATLKPHKSYEGWLVFEKPQENSVFLHYPDVQPVKIGPKKLVDSLDGSGSTQDTVMQASSKGSPTRVPTSVRGPTSTPRPAPTQTRIPAPTSTSTRTRLACTHSPKGEFVAVWEHFGVRLGCPVQEYPIRSDGMVLVEQPFSDGHMFYIQSGDSNFAFVKYGTGMSGRWEAFEDQWDGRNDNHCFDAQNIEPKIVRGFNLVWCNYPEIRDPLGWPLDVERDLNLELAQGFEHGFLLRDSDGYTNDMVYAFFFDGTYERVPY